VVFFNHGHLGDTLLSKPFIKEIKKYISSNKYYIANNYTNDYTSDVVDDHINITKIPATADMWIAELEDTLYFNTWFGLLNNPTSLAQLGVSPYDRECLKSLNDVLYNWANYLFFFNLCLKVYDSSCDIMYMNNDKLKYVLPTPQKELNIPFINSHKTKILIFNQIATSGQADNVDYTPYIKSLATNDILIYTSQKIQYTKDNIIQLPDYIQPPDLFDIASLSQHCDIICGPGNAPIIATWTRENLGNHNKTYITVNRNDIGEAIYFEETVCQNFVVKSTHELFQTLNIELYGKHV